MPVVSHCHWDIFCTVVDNYGDIGVTWRLAKQLSTEYHIPIKLWVDDLNSFKHILPELNPSLPVQTHQQITIIHWTNPLPISWESGTVLIEAFACELPQTVIKKLPTLTHPPLWINLDYLSAEPWIDDCHGLTSPAIAGIKKIFYFPGFTAKSGGLICEKSLWQQRDLWQQDKQHALTHLSRLGVDNIKENDYLISLFSYETPALAQLLSVWQNSNRPIKLLVPIGKSLSALMPLLDDFKSIFDERTSKNMPPPMQRNSLTIYPLPMTTQEDYDKLLWSCDFNIVRGEDSFLRAQWAAKPFIWHIYPQEEDAHLAKLTAFMTRYCDSLDANAAIYWQQLNLAFNNADTGTDKYWQLMVKYEDILLQHAKKWPQEAINNADLANKLVNMSKIGT